MSSRPAQRRTLHDGWTLTATGGPVPDGIDGVAVPATVPGTVHTDLLSAGLIPDPYLDSNESLLGWIGRCDWSYGLRFSWAPDGRDHHDLVFEGLDTVATIILNGTVIATTANQHRTYRISVDGVLVAGENELTVRFRGPVPYADQQSLVLGPRPHLNRHPYNAIRKMACNFGWDWGPDLATSGIWRPVSLHSWSEVRLAEVRPVVTVDQGTGHVAVHCILDRDETAGPVTITASVGEQHKSIQSADTSVVVEIEVPEVSLWWPRGYGDQPLYPVTVEVAAESGPLDQWTGQVGFRRVRLDQTPDEYGTSFTIVVNDQPVFVRGANWIPDDVFLPRVDRDRYAARIAQAEQANINLLRVWGGGSYESDDFYSLCDERGILTWQDFALACAAYTEAEPLRGEIAAEARDNIVRLMTHPSLVMWAGNNEGVAGYHNWGWPGRLDGQSWGTAYYTEIFPALLAELDPDRPYVPASPWAGSTDTNPHDHTQGPSHLWKPWNHRPASDYRSEVPRFVAEFGWQGPPTWTTLRRTISDDPLTPESPGMAAHQKAWHGNDKLTRGILVHFPMPTTMADWHWAASLTQAISVQLGIEHFRSYSPRCAGAVVWQLNDCWPVTSWAAIDGDGRPKPLFYALRRAFADRLVTIQPRSSATGEGLAAIVVNDSSVAWSGPIVIERRRFSGEVLADMTVRIDVPPRSISTIDIAETVADPQDEASELLTACIDDYRTEWFFRSYRDSTLIAPDWDLAARRRSGGYLIEITARNLIRDIAVLADKVHPDARVDDMLLTLFPGEKAIIEVMAPSGLDPAAFLAADVLRSANQLSG